MYLSSHVPVVIRSFPRRHPVRRIFFAALLLAAGALSAIARAEPQSLIADKLPSRSEGVKNASRLTDGVYSNEGDEWLTDVTSRFLSARSFVEYDLGAERTIRCALAQADNNDVYILSGSLDGESWQPLWRVGAEAGAGMRLRNQKLETSARYVRLSATGGDALYSVSEIALYASARPSGHRPSWCGPAAWQWPTRSPPRRSASGSSPRSSC